MSGPDQPIRAVCPGCGARIPLIDFRCAGFLRARRAADGGPYYELACSRCATMLNLRWEADGSRAVEPAARPGLLGNTFRASAEAPQIFPPERPEERAARDHRRPEPEPPPDEQPDPDPARAEPESLPELEPGESVERMREVLGIDGSAGRDSILAAFRERSKRMHPDRFTAFDRDFQDLAHRKFIELKRARDCLLAIMDRRDDRQSSRP